MSDIESMVFYERPIVSEVAPVTVTVKYRRTTKKKTRKGKGKGGKPCMTHDEAVEKARAIMGGMEVNRYGREAQIKCIANFLEWAYARGVAHGYVLQEGSHPFPSTPGCRT